LQIQAKSGSGSVSEYGVNQELTDLSMIKRDHNGAKRHKSMRIPSDILVLSVWLASVPGIVAQEVPDVLPKVVQHSEPIYPPLARQTRIQGDVRVKITTDGESVRNAEAETGHPLLRKAAEDNARTWKFVAHTPGTFHATFRYKLSSGNVDVEFLELPAIVEIEASPPVVSLDDFAWLGLGTWKAQLKSAHGEISQVFKLKYSGPKGEWLDGNAIGSKGESEEIDFGHKEGNFLAFTITLSQPDGQHVKTFLIGKMTGDKIVGSFVDDAGIRGEWTAVAVANSPNSR
jgi:TonB family protein